jgi:hypothetical protein
MTLRIPIGIDDFRRVREDKLEYVDKSDFIRQVIDRHGVEVMLVPRPRRFGKSLNLSMLRYWFEKRDEDLSHLFQDLSIWTAGDEYRAHFQKYPVIQFGFKECKHSDFERVFELIKTKIQDAYAEHRYLLSSESLSEWQLRDYRAILEGTASRTLFERGLLDLSAYLHAHHGQRVVILVDDFDEPMHAGQLHGFGAKVGEFIFGFLGAALKSNPHLQRSVMTSVLRIVEEKVLTGFNNVSVYSLLTLQFDDAFGFTSDEVASLLERVGRGGKLAEVRAWYGGYVFGGEVLYNPWSVLSYIHGEEDVFHPYWLQDGSSDWIGEILERSALRLAPEFEGLLEGRSVETYLDENVALSKIAADEEAFWSLLVFSGYLKAEPLPYDPVVGRVAYRVSIQNREIRQFYATLFQRWFKVHLDAQGGDVGKLGRALISGDDDAFEAQLQLFVQNILSSYEMTKVDPDRLFGGFVLGILAALEPEYIVRSNRESGGGRPDVTIRPRLAGKPGALLELKLARKGKKTPAAALREGLAQIRSKGYAAELWATGVSDVHAFAVAFDGKRVWVKASEPGDKKKGKGKK